VLALLAVQAVEAVATGTMVVEKLLVAVQLQVVETTVVQHFPLLVQLLVLLALAAEAVEQEEVEVRVLEGLAAQEVLQPQRTPHGRLQHQPV
jgi:hypothetical protein